MTTNKAVQNLLEAKTPCEWVGFLFDIQNSLVAYGDLESLDKVGAANLAAGFWELKLFFDALGATGKK